MRVLCAPDSFKETIHARAAAAALAEGVVAAGGEALPCPVADGGEGTLKVLADPATIRTTRVAGPLGEPIDARWACDDANEAIIELATCCGLDLVPKEARDPERTTTRGAGELIAAALAVGAQRILVAVGGTATCDGGAGLLQALGAQLIDDRGAMLAAPACGGDLQRIARVLLPPRVGATITVACDVQNPLLGPRGAAAVFAPQKGASPAAVARLEAGLARWSARLGGAPDAPGAGAAGGAAYGLAAGFGATLVGGAALVLERLDLAARCREVDLVLTGEGRLDAQTRHGKAPAAVARAAAAAGVPCIAIVGSADPAALANDDGGAAPFARVIVLEDLVGPAAARGNPAAALAEAARRALRDGV